MCGGRSRRYAARKLDSSVQKLGIPSTHLDIGRQQPYASTAVIGLIAKSGAPMALIRRGSAATWPTWGTVLPCCDGTDMVRAVRAWRSDSYADSPRHPFTFAGPGVTRAAYWRAYLLVNPSLSWGVSPRKQRVRLRGSSLPASSMVTPAYTQLAVLCRTLP
jgi:hypothetical protein